MLSVQQCFNAASYSYDDVAGVQQTCAELLVAQLFKQWPDLFLNSVLDLGTGTGFLPQLLLSKFPEGYFTLNDLSVQMLARAREKLGSDARIQYVLGNLETTAFGFHELTLSNLALQWVDDIEHVIQTHYMNSNRFAFSCLLDGTFAEWGALFKQCGGESPVKSYPTEKTLEHFLLKLAPDEYSFTIREFSIPFENARSFMRYLKKLGASRSAVQPSLSVLKTILKTNQHAFDVTYRVFFGVLKRA